MLGLGLALTNFGSKGGISDIADGVFSPLSLSPLAWWDVSDLTTLWQDTARTTPITADGQTVACIDDKSGNGHNLLQSSATLRPLFKTSGGLNWLLFDGVDDSLVMTANTATLTDTHEFTFCGRFTAPASGSSGGMISHSNGAAGVADAEMAIYNGAGTVRMRTRYPSLDTFSTGAVLTADADAVFAQGKFGFSDTRQYINGAQSGATITTTTTASTSPRSYRLGRHTNAAQFLSGRCHGVLVTPVLSAAQRASLTTWIGAKAGLTL